MRAIGPLPDGVLGGRAVGWARNTLVPKDQRVLQVRNSDGEIETARYDEGVGR